ncbi:MAG TPA: prepilin-type N-terminal cleavage/methylation domain-containing protein [Candidatus Saccharimonadales bacterium]|nr:prepilin-type N-terminal cleavage/methylation domain-containing protein [Candidatus Saccharimonadales bacterium]
MKNNKKNEKGFSAVELILVIVVVGLLVIIGWLVYKNSSDKSKTSKSTNTSNASQQQASVGNAPCSKEVTDKANSYNTDAADNRVTCALTYGQQQSDKLAIDNGDATVVSALYATQFGSTAFSQGEAGIANVVIHNSTTNNQMYDLNQFTLQLPGGEQKTLHAVYDSSDTAVQVAADGHAVVTLLYIGINPSAAEAGNGKLVYTSQSNSTNSGNVSITFKKAYSYTN